MVELLLLHTLKYILLIIFQYIIYWFNFCTAYIRRVPAVFDNHWIMNMLVNNVSRTCTAIIDNMISI